MKEAILSLVRLGIRVAFAQPLGPAAAEGYLPTGVRQPVVCDQPGHQRALSMLIARLKGGEVRSELMAVDNGPAVTPAAPVASAAATVVGLVTSGGLVPRGNPDRMPSCASTRLFQYKLPDGDMDPQAWESIHAGFNYEWVNRNPNFVLPLDAARALVRAGRLGSLAPYFYSLAGVMTKPPAARQIATDLVGRLFRDGVQAVILVAT
jgi:glycine reductase